MHGFVGHVDIFNDITRNIIPSNGIEIFPVYYGYRYNPQAHGYTIVAISSIVFQDIIFI